MTKGPSAPRPFDPRAGILCTSCNRPAPADPRPHCPSPACAWWRCDGCGADNDAMGRNSRTDDAGLPKKIIQRPST